MIRWHILKALLHKELDRHLADRGAFFLALLLIGATLLLTAFGKEETDANPMMGGVQLFYVDAFGESERWVEHLRAHPPVPRLNVLFRNAQRLPRNERGHIHYQESSAAVQIRPLSSGAGGESRFEIVVHSGGNHAALAPYLTWFWSESLRYFRKQGLPVEIETPDFNIIPPEASVLDVLPIAEPGQPPRYRILYVPEPEPGLRERWQDPLTIQVVNEELPGRASERTIVMTGMVLFPVCFFCFFFLPAFTCEERERGVLLAQVLSPANTREILTAKFLFYPGLGVALAVVLAGIHDPRVLYRPFFWLCLLVVAVSYLGVGLTIASLARTQRAASMGAMCYMLTVAMLLFLSQRFQIEWVRHFLLEFYCPKILHAALLAGEPIAPMYWIYLALALVLTIAWTAVATFMFRRHGWQ